MIPHTITTLKSSLPENCVQFSSAWSDQGLYDGTATDYTATDYTATTIQQPDYTATRPYSNCDYTATDNTATATIQQLRKYSNLKLKMEHILLRGWTGAGFELTTSVPTQLLLPSSEFRYCGEYFLSFLQRESASVVLPWAGISSISSFRKYGFFVCSLIGSFLCINKVLAKAFAMKSAATFLVGKFFLRVNPPFLGRKKNLAQTVLLIFWQDKTMRFRSGQSTLYSPSLFWHKRYQTIQSPFSTPFLLVISVIWRGGLLALPPALVNYHLVNRLTTPAYFHGHSC